MRTAKLNKFYHFDLVIFCYINIMTMVPNKAAKT